MKNITITRQQFENLKHLKEFISLESELYLYEKDSNIFVLKRLYEDFKEEFNNKLYTITELSKNKDIINIPELVIPEYIVKLEGKTIAFTVPYISELTLENILNSNKYTVIQKIEYLKQIGIILEQMKQVRKNTEINNFYLNDIHEGNFVLNKETNKMNVIDLDSSKIGINEVNCAKYLTPFSQITLVSKYKQLKNSIGGGVFEINENTDLYCYIIMILNYIYGSNINKLSIEEYYNYLEYLLKLGISKELVDKLSYIYSNHNNENIYEYLDELIPYYEKTNKIIL